MAKKRARRKMHDRTPSCNYYWNRHCDSREVCPTHRQIDLRASKRTHVLRADSLNVSNETYVPIKTVCGLKLRQNYSLDDLTSGRVPGVFDSRPAEYEYLRLEPQPPSDNPNVRIYHQRGWDNSEVLVAVKNPTCHVCRRCAS